MAHIYGLLFTMVDASIKATVLLALAASVAVLSRRTSASFRHLVWALGLGCVLVLPLLSGDLPHWRIPVATPATHSLPAAALPPPLADTPQQPPVVTSMTDHHPQRKVSDSTTTTTTTVPLQTVAQQTAAATSPATPPTASPIPQVPWSVWMLLIWAGGTALILARLAQGLAVMMRITRASVPVTVGPAAEAAAVALGVGRPVALRKASTAGRVTVPLTFGARRAVIVLPADAQGWPEDRLRAALLHEMAHVRRGDWVLQVMAHLACSLYWFHPLAWFAARRMRAEAEAACDDLVLGAGMPAQDYARHLLDVALSARQARRVGWGAVAMAQSPKVEGRLRAVLAQGIPRRPVTIRTAAGLVVAALILVVPVAALRLIAQGEAVPAADHLQLQGDFTLRYAATVTDLEPVQAQLREYQQLRADYNGLLKKDPHFQPVPAEYYGPFAYFQERRPKTRHLVLTVSARDGHLLWQSAEKDETYALLYDGHSTHSYGNGHAGSVQPVFEFGMMSDCPLPAVGLPHAPLLKDATIASTAGADQTWAAQCLVLNAEGARNAMAYAPGTIRAVKDSGTWKVLSADSLEQRLDFLEHQRFQSLWIASRFRLTKYDTSAMPPQGQMTTMQQAEDWIRARRTPTSVCDYRLLSASGTPLDMSTLGMRAASTAARALQSPPLDDADVQEALHLRFHLQDWARSHAALLRRMGRAAPSDFSWVTAVDKSLPALHFRLWRGVDTLLDNDPPSGNARDFVIARSRNSGAIPVYLWASGRITRVTAGIRGQEEIVPAFFGGDGTSSLAGDASPESASGGSPGPRVGPQLAGEAASHVALGQKLQQQGQPRDGIPEFRRAVALDPNDADAQDQLAQALYQIRDKHFRAGLKDTLVGLPTPPAAMDEAIRHMERAVALRPDDADWHSALGTYLSTRGRYAEAIAQYRRALHLLPPVGPVNLERGVPQSVSQAAQSTCDNNWLLGDALVKARQYQEALPHYREALRFRPSADWMLLGYGDALHGARRTAEARASWRKLLTVQPPNPYYQRQARARLAGD